jgi:hypothetical protein
MKTKFLLPNKYKKVGWVLMIPSAIFGLFTVFTNFEPEWLKVPMFTFFADKTPFSSEETIYFSTITTNIANEIAAIFFLVSAILVAFSKAKNEDEFITKLRLESLVWSTYIHFGILLIGMLFLFNIEFFTFMIFNMFTLLLVFIVKFNVSLFKSKRL